MRPDMRMRRLESGKSLAEVSRETGIPYRTLQDWQRFSMQRAALEDAIKVADCLGCPVKDLVRK
jgi:lambda repressor-like predicted transcriptional regulator